MKPKVGLLEGQQVAFLTLSSRVFEGPDERQIKVLNASSYASQLPAIRADVESKVNTALVPSIWVVLERMPLDQMGNPDRRELQTWAQNVNEDMYQHIRPANVREQLTQPTTDSERLIQRSVSQVLMIEQSTVGMNLPFIRLGGDMKSAKQLKARCRSFGLILDTRDILRSASLAHLVSLAKLWDESDKSRAVDAETFELSPMQHLYFTTSMGEYSGDFTLGRERYRFNQSMLFRLKKATAIESIRIAVETVVKQHAMLRCRFHRVGNTWRQSTEQNFLGSFHFGDHTISTDDEVEEIILEAQTTIDVEHGPVFAAYHLRTQDGYQMLYLIAHHLVIDSKSWKIIMDDLEALMTRGVLSSGRVQSFKEWIDQQRTMARDAQSLDCDAPPADWDYWGISENLNTYGNSTTTGFTIGKETIAMLGDNIQAIRTDCTDIFMAATILSFVQSFKDRAAPVSWNQEHNRATVSSQHDLSEVVGCFTYLCPLKADITIEDDLSSAVGRIRDSRTHMASGNVPDFMANLKDEHTSKVFLARHCPLEILFTVADATDDDTDGQGSLLEQLRLPGQTLSSNTSDIGTDVGRISIFDVSACINNGEVRFKFVYHNNSYHQDLIKTWIRRCEKLLVEGIKRHQLKFTDFALTDIPHVDADYEGLRRLNKSILPGLHLTPPEIEDIYPVTITQEDILIKRQLVPGSSDCSMIFDFEVDEEYIDVGRICTAWQKVCDKQPALRTVFAPSVSKAGLYSQIIIRHHSPNMLFLEAEEDHDALRAIGDHPPLPLTEGIPWHRLVVCQASTRVLVKIEADQALCDGASLAILFEELEQAYLGRQIPQSPQLPVADYLQHIRLSRNSIEFWKDRMSGFSSSIFPHLASKKKEWSNPTVTLPIRRERLEAFARTYRINMATIFQAAWAMLLRTYISSNDVCFGYRKSGREQGSAILQDAVGCFSNVLICRLAVPNQQIIAQILLDAEDSSEAALKHQHVDIGHIQHALKVRGRDLFNTCISFGYEDVSRSYLLSSDMTFIASQRSSYLAIDANIGFAEGSLCLDLGNRILNSDQAIHVAHVFGRAVAMLLDHPDSTIRDTDLFTELDHQQILSWNSKPGLDISVEHIHNLIARRATANPDIQAVTSWDGDFSYHELVQLSKALAGHLLLSGLKSHSPVVVIMEKSRWSIVAMLAVLHAGAVLVPVDAEAKGIIQYVLQVVNPQFILASDNAGQSISKSVSEIILINEFTVPAMSVQSATLGQAETRSHHAACLLFEHGCAKSNKCISYSHGALATACLGQGPTLRLNPSSRVMQLSSFSVDIALSEVFTTLVHGGCVCVPSATERITDFTSAARRMNVNWTYLTPILSRKLNPENLPDIAVVCFRTHEIDDDTYALWAGKAKILLVYGSAGACPLGLSASEITGSSTTQCIGSPFCGNFWIVSAEDTTRLMPVGAVGQLVIGSPTLGCEFDLAEQDVASWIEKISCRSGSWLDLEDPDMRLLHTGRCVRYSDHGQIEFVARDFEAADTDGNIFRFSDIEPKLRRSLGRGVDVVVEVIKLPDQDCRPVLAAFVELGENLFHGKDDLFNLSPTTKERLYLAKKMAETVLRETLPSHMIPTAYIPIKQMPLTPSLKVNRTKLRKMVAELSRHQLLELSEVPNHREVEADGLKPLPMTDTEMFVRGIWASILDIPEASITANHGFMSLGGDIVLARDLVFHCGQEGFPLAVVDVLRDLTLAQLCRSVSGDKFVHNLNGSTQTSAFSPTDRLAEVLDIGQTIGLDRTRFEDVAEATSLQALSVEAGSLTTRGNVNYLVLSISGSLDWAKLESACSRLTQAHPVLRTGFKTHDRKLYQVVSKSHQVDFERHQCPNWRLSNLATKMIKKDQALPADFDKPMTKFIFVDAGKNSILILRLSSAQYDEKSVSTLFKDISLLYGRGDRTLRRPSFCEAVRVSHATYSRGTEEYWRLLLDGASMTQIVSRTSPTIQSATSKTIVQRMPIGPLQNLGVPFETILKGSWSVVLSNLACSDDVVFGHLVESSRIATSEGRADVVGPRSNIIPVRIRLPDIGITPYEFFRCVQSQHIASTPHEDMQFSDIIQRCTDWAPWAIFSSVVQHQHEPNRDAVIDKITIGDAVCKLDLLESNHQHTDILVRSSISSADAVEISLAFDEKRIPAFFADDVLKTLCTTITLLTSAFVTESLFFKGLHNSHNASPKIPLHVPRHEGTKQPGSVQNVTPEHARAINLLISNAWDAVLDAQAHCVADIRAVPFYKVWGSLIPAAELAKYYSKQVANLGIVALERATFTMEDMVDNPTMMQQYELIISRQAGPPQVRRNSSLNPSSRAGNWGAHIRRLGPERSGTLHYSSGGGRGGTPVISHLGVASGGSMESMTTGSSQSDRDELRDGALGSSSSATSPSRPATRHAKKPPLTLGKLKLPTI
ncbi:fumiquinazoline F synthetase [Microdochium nivale]|nr:fumiquinazoline F synthetase [Microdochium nivale]